MRDGMEEEIIYKRNMLSGGVGSDWNAWNDWKLKRYQAPSQTSQASTPPRRSRGTPKVPPHSALQQSHDCRPPDDRKRGSNCTLHPVPPRPDSRIIPTLPTLRA